MQDFNGTWISGKVVAPPPQSRLHYHVQDLVLKKTPAAAAAPFSVPAASTGHMGARAKAKAKGLPCPVPHSLSPTAKAKGQARAMS